MVSIYSRENHQFHICYREFDKFVCKTSEMTFFKTLYHFSRYHQYVNISWKYCFFVSHVGKIWKIFLFFSFFREIFLMKIITGNLFLLFFYMKKELHVGEIKKNVIRKSDFFCKIYRHVRQSLILICTLMSSMGKIDQHFEKWF